MKTKGKKHRGRGCLTALIILALIAAAAAFLIKDSREDLEISRYEVNSKKLPESFDGFKIVQLSDLHGAEFGEDGMGLVEKVKELEPDIIALTGDFVTDEGDLAAVKKLAGWLTELCPVYFVSGNHEFGSGLAVKVRNILERAGVKYLSNEYLTISRGEDEILLGGVEDPLAYADMLSPDELAQKMNDAACVQDPARASKLLDDRIPRAAGRSYLLRPCARRTYPHPRRGRTYRNRPPPVPRFRCRRIQQRPLYADRLARPWKFRVHSAHFQPARDSLC